MFSTIQKFLGLLNRHERRRFVVIVAAALAMGILQVAGIGSIVPFIALIMDPDQVQQNQWLSWAFTALGFSSTQRFLLFTGAFVLVLFLAANAVILVTQWLTIRFTRDFQYRLSTSLLERYLSRPYVTLLNRNSADIGKNVLVETERLAAGVAQPLMNLIAYGIMTLFIMAFLIWLSPVMALLVAGILGGSYALIFVSVQRWLRRAGHRRMLANTQRFKAAAEAFGGIKETKVLGREANFVARFQAPALDHARITAVHSVLGMVPRYAIEGAAFGILLLMVLYLLWVRGEIQSVIPLASAYVFAAYRLLPALQNIYQSVAQIHFNEATVDALAEDMREVPDGYASSRSRESEDRLPFRQGLVLEDVSFTYPNATDPALQDVSFTIPYGSSVAFVGATGAGKTTLVNIILGLLQPQKGTLAVDGVPMNESNTREWQNNLGYVPQDIYLCDDTVAGNIAFGVPRDKVNMQAVEKAAHVANIHDFVVQDLPDSYDTIVGERGVRLSGGEQQRIGLARALYHDPEVLVLDEATNALDGATESAVMEAIHSIAGSKTLVVIAHRSSALKKSDVIYLLDKGRLVAQGTYDELINSDPRFRAMARRSVTSTPEYGRRT